MPPLCREGKQAVNTSQEDKQSTNFKKEALLARMHHSQGGMKFATT